MHMKLDYEEKTYYCYDFYSKRLTEYFGRQYRVKLNVKPFNIIAVGQKESFLIPKIVRHFAERKEKYKLVICNLNKIIWMLNAELEFYMN